MAEGVGGADGAGAGNAGGANGAGGVGGAEGAGRAGESNGVSASDRADVSNAADTASSKDVDAQADAVAGPANAEDGMEAREAKKDEGDPEGAAAAAASAPRGPSEGTLAERERRDEEARVEAERGASAPRGPSEGTMAERERRDEEARENADRVASTPRGPSEGTLAERERRDINAAANALAEKSPTAKGLVDGFRAAGGTFVTTNGAAYFNKERMEIGIPAGTLTQRQQYLAHELGHFDYRNHPDNRYSPPGRPTGATDRQIEARREAGFITSNANRQLADEGNAALVNKTIRDEFKAATGIDIGISGNWTGMMPFGGGTLAQQRQAIGDYFGTNLTTSTTGQNYRDYYNSFYQGYYERNFAPGQER